MALDRDQSPATRNRVEGQRCNVMTIRNFQLLLRPRSVALIGASARPGSVGLITARNLLAGGFAGPIWLVNPEHGSSENHACFPSVAALPEAPELAVIVTPPA